MSLGQVWRLKRVALELMSCHASVAKAREWTASGQSRGLARVLRWDGALVASGYLWGLAWAWA